MNETTIWRHPLHIKMQDVRSESCTEGITVQHLSNHIYLSTINFLPFYWAYISPSKENNLLEMKLINSQFQHFLIKRNLQISRDKSVRQNKYPYLNVCVISVDFVGAAGAVKMEASGKWRGGKL